MNTCSAPATTMGGAGVSVVIPAYNYASYLRTTLESVLAQTYPHFEVIVVDDGSTDPTREVVEACADPRVRYVWQQNAGLSASRNTGIREAKFPFIAFLDADDLWRPEFLATVMEQFRRLPAEYGAVATGTSRIDEAGRPSPFRNSRFEKDGELSVRDFVMRNRPMSSSIVIQRTVFDECGGFDTSLRSSEDRDMWIRLTARRRRFWHINQPLGLIRRHGANMSKNAARMKRNSRAVLRKAFCAGAVSRWDAPFWLKVFSVHFFQIACTHFDEGERAKAFRYLLTSVALWPLFVHPNRFFEPRLFRIRAAARFLRQMLRRVAA